MKKLLLLLLSFAPCAMSQTIPRMVEIPGGSFYMGSLGEGENWDEAPMHKVNVSPFKMSETEITNAQFEQYSPSHRQLRGKNAGISSLDNEAVVFVSYDDAVGYCRWLSEKTGRMFRLPTEAEWEYACKAGSYYPYSFGESLPRAVLRNQRIVRDFKKVSLEVGVAPKNAFGLYDMHGNVEEWCHDWYGLYDVAEATDPAGPASGDFRVTRGGSHSTPVEYLKSTCRMAMIPSDRHSQTGFRIVEGPIGQETPVKAAGTGFKSRRYNWKHIDGPLFREPMVYVQKPSSDSRCPLYSHNHQPAVCWCGNGDILVAWFSANAENGRSMVEMQSRLSPGSGNWEPAQLFFRVPGRNITGLSLMNDNGIIRHINGVEASGDWQNLAMVQRVSYDDGHTWTSPSIIEPEHQKRHQVIAGCKRLSDGTLIQLCDAGPGGDDGTSVHLSRDDGKTWYDPWDGVAVEEFRAGESGTTIAGIHASVVELSDGRLLAFGRGNTIDGRMPCSISSDKGRTWTYSASPFPPINGGQRLVLMRLSEGPILLLSFTDHPLRTPEAERGMLFRRNDGSTFKGYGLFAALSFDEGKTWPVMKLVTDGKYRLLNGGAWTQFFEMDSTHAEPRGYMAATQSPDGIIHLVSSRIYYAFNLEWLLSD